MVVALATLRRRWLIWALLGGCVGGIGWTQRERIWKLLRTIRSLYRTGSNAALTAEVLSRDLYQFIEYGAEGGSDLPKSFRRLLLILRQKEVLDGLAVVAKAISEGVISQMPKDPDALQKVLASTEVERLAVLVVRTAAREVVRGVVQKPENGKTREGDGGLLQRFGPDTVAEYLKNETIRAAVVEMVSSIVVTTQQRANLKKDFPSFNMKCGVGNNRRSSGPLRSNAFSAQTRSQLALNALASTEKKPEQDMAEKILMMAMRDKELVRAVTSESVKTYLTTKRELQQGKKSEKPVDSKTETEATSDSSEDKSEDAPASTTPKRTVALRERNGRSSTAWWLTKTFASGAWQYAFTR